MKKYATAAILLLGLGAAGVALADDVECHVAMSKWQPRGAVKRMAEAQGWTVRRIKTDDGCYEIKGRDAEGRGIEVKLDPETLAVVSHEYEDHDDDNSGRHKNKTPSETPATHAKRLGSSGQSPVVE